MDHHAVHEFFLAYEAWAKLALANKADLAEFTATMYAPAFVASTPSQAKAATNGDGSLATVLGAAWNGRIAQGQLAMRLRTVDVVPIDGDHCVARVDWTSSYTGGRTVEFQVNYLLGRYGLERRLALFGVVTDETRESPPDVERSSS